MRLTPSMVRGRAWLTSPCMIHSKPSSIPTTSMFSKLVRIVAALITLLMPGAGPPPTRMPTLPLNLASRGRRLERARQRGDRVRHLGVSVLEQEVRARGLVPQDVEVRLARLQLTRERVVRPVSRVYEHFIHLFVACRVAGAQVHAVTVRRR